MDVPVNYVAVLLAGVASMVIGFIWYGPLFGKMWMKLSGITKEKIEEGKKNMPVTYGTMFVGSLIMAYVLAHFTYFAGATTVAQGMQAGFWAWLGFVATVGLSSILFEGKPMNLYFINVGYQLANLLVMGAIIAGWR